MAVSPGKLVGIDQGTTFSAIATLDDRGQAITLPRMAKSRRAGHQEPCQHVGRCVEPDAPVLRVHQADVPMPYAKNLERAAKPDVPKTIAAVRKVMYLD